MCSVSDFVIQNGMLVKYVGPGGDVVIPENVWDIRPEAFSKRTDIQHVTLPEGCRNIWSFAFFGCTGLREIIFPPSVNTISESSFSGCSSLERIVILRDTASVAWHAFANCSKLQHVHIRSDKEFVNSQAFEGCDAIRSLECPAELMSTVFSVGCITSYLLGDYTLEEDLLQHVTRRIRRRKKLFFKSIVGHNSEMATAKFLQACGKVELDDLNEMLEMSAGAGSHLASAVLLAYKNSQYSADAVEKHEQIKEGKELGEIPLTLQDWKKIYSIEVDGDKITIKKYKGTDEIVIIPAQMGDKKVVSVGSHAFAKREDLREVVISEGIREMGNGVFSGCSNLEHVAIPDGMKKMDDFLFSKCTSLKQVSVPDGVQLGGAVFHGCKALEQVDLPAELSLIDQWLFKGCSGLQRITIPEGVKKISTEAFSGCRSLTDVVIPESLTQIDYQAFSGCSKLKDIRLPAGIKSIKKDSFEKCKKLVIHAPAGSYAETYALKHGIPFVAE